MYLKKTGKKHAAICCAAFLGLFLTASCSSLSKQMRTRNALGFDGKSYIKVPDSEVLNPSGSVTFEAWINPCKSGDQKIIGKSPIGTGYVIGLSDNQQVYAEFWDNKSNHISLQAGRVELERLSCITITYSIKDKKVTAYVDGIMKGYEVIPGNPVAPNSNPLIIGAAPWNQSSLPYTGLVEEIRIYKRALSPKQVKHNFTAETSREDLAAEWILTRGDGKVALDSGPNKCNGKIVGAEWISKLNIRKFFDKIRGLVFKPVWLPAPRRSIYPRSQPPSGKFYFFDASSFDSRTKIFLATLQGVINQKKPTLYICMRKPSQTANAAEDLSSNHDLRWFKWLTKNGYLKKSIKLKSIEEILETFKIKKVIQPDPSFACTLNIATMLAGIKGLPVAYHETSKKYNLTVAMDLKGRWKTNIDAYQWVFKKLWPFMDHTCLACLAPIPDLAPLRDYLVAKKIFTFWITGSKDGNNDHSNPKEEVKAISHILDQMPVNIPVLGYPWAGDNVGIGEGGGVTLLSRAAKFLIPADWKGNLSVWTGLRAKTEKFQQLPARDIRLEKDKVYITFLMSDGDNLNTWYDYFPKYWTNPYHGRIPIAWTMGPSLIDLQPPLLDYYYSTMKDTDSLGCAVSGIGYIYAQHYAKDFGKAGEAVWKDFLKLTERYMKKLDQGWIWVMRSGPKKGKQLRDYADNISGLKAIFADYGGRTPYKDADYLLNRTAVFHSINRWGKNEIVSDIVSQVPEKLPAFMHVFLLNWDYSLNDVKKLMDSLPANVVVVRPDQLSKLYKENLTRQVK